MTGRPQQYSQTQALELLEYIKYYQALHGWMPSIREMADHFDKSTSMVSRWINLFLVPMGKLVKQEGTARGLRLIESSSRQITVYLCPACDYYSSSKITRCPDHVLLIPVAYQFKIIND